MHSLATAAGSKMICDELRLGLPDEAFLAGLLHDVRIMVELQAHRNELVSIFDELPVNVHGLPIADLREIEQRVLGADHEDFGAGLCESWKFPRSFLAVTGHHHDPMALPPGNRTLAHIVHLADRLSARLGYGFRGDLPKIEPVDGVMEELGIDQAQIDKIAERLPRAYQDVESTFG